MFFKRKNKYFEFLTPPKSEIMDGACRTSYFIVLVKKNTKKIGIILSFPHPYGTVDKSVLGGQLMVDWSYERYGLLQ